MINSSVVYPEFITVVSWLLKGPNILGQKEYSWFLVDAAEITDH
jgi:hypothetical protein